MLSMVSAAGMRPFYRSVVRAPCGVQWRVRKTLEKKGGFMAIKDALLPEFDHEMATARKVIERVPEATFGYKPHEKSMTMGVLASHIADMPSWATVSIAQDSLDMASGFKPFEAKSNAELL